MRIVDCSEVLQKDALRRRPMEQMELPERVAESITRYFGQRLTAEEVVDRIISAVRDEGDGAVLRFTTAFDGVAPKGLEVGPEEIEAAYLEVPENLLDALRLAAEQITAFHQRQLPQSWTHFDDLGALGQIVRPLRRVGVYAPGGRAIYPSTVLMTAIPARVAGVSEIVLTSPPGRDGRMPALVRAAAGIAGVDRVFAVGGAQAVAAMAYGTSTIPQVDKILGPGNLFVTLAKKKVFGQVAIDQLAGPTETVVIADRTADPRSVALDILAQAEHDPLASAILITTSADLAIAVGGEIDCLLRELSRAEIARTALDANGLTVIVKNLDQAIDLANEYAPEHLCLLVDDPWSLVGRVHNAGGIFLGEHSPEVMGDYIAGPSHVMPTGGTARFASPLNVLDFVKISSLIALSRLQMAKLGPAAATIAEAEGLTAHAAAVRARLGDEN